MVNPKPCASVTVFQNGLLDHGFVARKVDPWFFMSKTVICVPCVDDCLLCLCLKSEIDKLLNY